ncbi:DUF6643 family protein [Streptomyces sp. NPDC006879]|uniref:DUF6643 family protein n=1 Tax=Streptomyces sp. NPDC006879 TaxID=3364767 RepID=UPI0036A6856E
MTPPRSTYGGGYSSAPSFPDTPIYDSLVAERGTPQIAPIRVPAAYESPFAVAAPQAPSNGYLPARPAALPALPAGPSQQPAPGYGYPYPQQAAPLQPAPAPQFPQQGYPPRGGYPAPQQPMPAPVPVATATATGYEAMRPAAPRPMQAPTPSAYQDPYGRPYQGRGY